MTKPPPQSFHSVGNEKGDDKELGAIVLSPTSQSNDKSITQSSPRAHRKCCLHTSTGGVLANRTPVCMCVCEHVQS